MDKNVEIMSAVTLSTAHLSSGTRSDILDNPDRWEGVVFYKKADPQDEELYGWFMYILPEQGLQENNEVWAQYYKEDSNVPADLRDCILFALEHGCHLIIFDRDAELSLKLPIYCNGEVIL